MSTYRVQVFLVGLDKERARQLREALARIIRGVGPRDLKSIMRRAYDGERVLIYESNDDPDALAAAQSLEASGGAVVVEGLREPEELF